jgi:hypothetical protein
MGTEAIFFRPETGWSHHLLHLPSEIADISGKT